MAENGKVGSRADVMGAGEEAAAASAGRQPASAGRQMSLLPAAPGGQVEEPQGPRGPGRPAGAKNKRTQHWQRWFEATGSLPLEFLAGVYRARTADLADELSTSTEAALRIQVQAAQAVLPYVEQKLPLAIEDAGDQGNRTVIVIGQMTVEQKQQAGSELGWMLLDDSQQNQGLIDGEAAVSDAQSSDDVSSD
jgi:hypothetical protein